MMSWNPAWDDAGSAWWAKANRARAHIEALDRLVGEFHESQPYSLTPEPVDADGRVPYRLRISKQVPVAISVTIGDVLSNLRAALESLAYEIARLGQGGTLSREQQGVPTFPIRATPQAFDAFFDKKKAALYDSRARAAMRAVQPFVHLETVLNEGVEISVDYAQWFSLSELHRLDALWNIDKHRRLTILAWRPDVIWWNSSGPSNRQLLPGDGTMRDGSILFYIEGSDEGQGTGLNHDFKLVLTDDPALSSPVPGQIEDVVSLLDRMHQHVTEQVFPVVFTLMSQNLAPAQSGS